MTTKDTSKKNNRIVKRVTGLIAVIAMIAVVAAATIVGTNDASAADMRPFKGEVSGHFTGGDSGVGTIIATHIGRGEVDFNSLVLNYAGGAPVGSNICFPVVSGNQTFTAANGDELHMSYTGGDFCADGGTMLPAEGQFSLTVIGGTGRFEEAVGHIGIDAVAGEFPNFTSTFTDDSWIHF
jgi:hypothetical protein